MSKILPGRSPAEDLLLTVRDEGSQPRNWGLLVTGILGGSLVALYSIATPFLAPALRKHCLPFVPATPKQIDNVLHMLKGRSGSLVDIGSGDGRIVIAAAKAGFKAVGYELNPWLVWYSRYCAWKGGVHHSTKFYVSDLWKMPRLEEKLGEELQLDAKVVACRFPFPHWKSSHQAGEGIDRVWGYNSESFRMNGKMTQL
ncbi:ATP synthase subunit C lysine N-methyltransferase isoform X2 [Eublepharis macularius]|uniref:ATP synthase subunit C lysine N-methyltransferase isoform X2 n=1 Tax=Eublepharis macularius TaxID=481883 RepID=A0AA97L4I0_EUBMA|nr:ATP synthase subunit C lysine N-methyltransferase isoform X2 [Eublepharis macularius]